jgi:ferredoxin-NADP reductase
MLIRPGMWANLRVWLGADDAVDDKFNCVERQYTVVEAGQGCMFAVTVRNLEPCPDGFGGVSRHLCTAPDFRALRVALSGTGGDFHYHQIVPPLMRIPATFFAAAAAAASSNSPMNVLWLTAGIGITPFIAFMVAMSSIVTAAIAKNTGGGSSSGLPIRVVHLHAEKSYESLAHPGLIKQWLAQRLVASFGLFLTQSKDAASSSRVPADVRSLLGDSLHFGGRFTGSGAIAQAVSRFGGAAAVTVMMCGPDAFMNVCRVELEALGVPSSKIFLERFD